MRQECKMKGSSTHFGAKMALSSQKELDIGFTLSQVHFEMLCSSKAMGNCTRDGYNFGQKGNQSFHQLSDGCFLIEVHVFCGHCNHLLSLTTRDLCIKQCPNSSYLGRRGREVGRWPTLLSEKPGWEIAKTMHQMVKTSSIKHMYGTYSVL